MLCSPGVEQYDVVSGLQSCEELPCFVLFLLFGCECACVFGFGLHFDGEWHVSCDACLVVGEQCVQGFVCGLSDDDEQGFHMFGSYVWLITFCKVTDKRV